MRLIDKIRRLLNFEGVLKKQSLHHLYLIKAEYLTQMALSSTESGISEIPLCEADVVVSLTSFGKRVSEVYLTIESIMQGTVKPNKIVLWLAEEFKERPLPVFLQKQQKRGLEIRFCNDIRSYEKLVPMLREDKKAVIVTIDDDNIYLPDMLERLVNGHIETPEHIIANRVHRVMVDSTGHPLPYFKWEWEYSKESVSYRNFLTGVGGVLYPPDCFCDEVLNQDVFLDICKYADDVWFYAMAIKSGRKIRKILTHSPNSQEYIENPDVQDVGLYHTNLETASNSNDVQINAVFEKYDLFSKLV